MTDIFGNAPELEKLTTGEEMTRAERKEVEDMLCDRADDFFGCAVDLRDVLLQLEHRRTNPSQAEVAREVSDVLRDYDALADLPVVTGGEEVSTSLSSEAERVKEEAETLQQESEERAEEVMEYEEEEIEEDIDAEIEEDIFEILQMEKTPQTLDSLKSKIDEFSDDEVESRTYELLSEGLLEQDIIGGTIVFLPSTWDDEAEEKIPTVTLHTDALNKAEGQWLDEHEEFIEGVDEIKGEVHITEEGYDEFESRFKQESEPTEKGMREEAQQAMIQTSSKPQFVEAVLRRKDEGKIDDDEFEFILKEEFGEEEFNDIRNSAIEVIKKHEG